MYYYVWCAFHMYSIRVYTYMSDVRIVCGERPSDEQSDIRFSR